VFGFKCFLVPSGVAEFENVGEGDLRTALPALAATGVPLLVHAELSGPIEAAAKRATKADPRKYQNWLRSRPPAAETEAIEILVRLARKFEPHIHIVHLSSALSVPLIQRAKKEGLRITAETCPHYLYFASGNIKDGQTLLKCAPPIRDSRNGDGLWAGLDKTAIDLVVSDHSPAPPGMKCIDTGDFFKAWGGISSLQLGLSVMWTKLVERKYSLSHLAQWMCSGTARLAGLESRKGSIAKGYDADIVVWNPEKLFTVRPSMLQHRHKATPYIGQSLRGVVEATFLNGEIIYKRGRFRGAPRGALLRRGKS
jgi:allantoinase